MENLAILVYDVLDSSENSNGKATGMDKPQLLKEKILNTLRTEREVTLDMANMRSLSPSFAYEAFGKLYDVFGDDIQSRLKFVNDERDLQKRIFSALDRRKEVLRFQ